LTAAAWGPDLFELPQPPSTIASAAAHIKGRARRTVCMPTTTLLLTRRHALPLRESECPSADACGCARRASSNSDGWPRPCPINPCYCYFGRCTGCTSSEHLCAEPRTRLPGVHFSMAGFSIARVAAMANAGQGATGDGQLTATGW